MKSDRLDEIERRTGRLKTIRQEFDFRTRSRELRSLFPAAFTRVHEIIFLYSIGLDHSVRVGLGFVCDRLFSDGGDGVVADWPRFGRFAHPCGPDLGEGSQTPRGQGHRPRPGAEIGVALMGRDSRCASVDPSLRSRLRPCPRSFDDTRNLERNCESEAISKGWGADWREIPAACGHGPKRRIL